MGITYTRTIDVLFLCTGNVCRSPVAEAFLRHRLECLGVEARVSSAGLLQDGQAASEHSLELLRRRGIPLDSHRSRLVQAEWLRQADLVLGMARTHVREAVVRAPDAWPRTFTLKDLVRRATEVGVRVGEEDFGAWLGRVHQGRSMSDYMGDSPDDDVADPIGRPRQEYERMVDEVEALVDHFVELAWAVESAQSRHHPSDHRRSP